MRFPIASLLLFLETARLFFYTALVPNLKSVKFYFNINTQKLVTHAHLALCLKELLRIQTCVLSNLVTLGLVYSDYFTKSQKIPSEAHYRETT